MFHLRMHKELKSSLINFQNSKVYICCEENYTFKEVIYSVITHRHWQASVA